MEKRFGFLNVKSGASGIYFHVQMNGDRFTSPITTGTRIHSFDTQRLNIGNAMNLSSGVFTASKPGIYHFSASFIKTGGGIIGFISPDALRITLRLNGRDIVEAYGDTGVVPVPVTAQATLKLKRGDRIDLYKHSGELTVFNCSHSFTGWLIDEDIE